MSRLLIVLLLGLSQWVFALNTVAVSPDGKHVVTGGSSNVLFVLNPTTFDVVKRIWIGDGIASLAFTWDSRCCLVNDGRGAAFDTSTWEPLPAANRSGALAAEAPVAAAVTWKDREPTLVVKSLPEWTEIKVIPLPKEPRPGNTVVLSRDGATAFVFAENVDDPDEKEVDAGEEPKDHFRKNFWRWRNDGRASLVYEVDLKSGEVVKTHKLWTGSSGKQHVFPTSYGVVMENYSQFIGILDREKGYEAFWTGQFAYGGGLISDDVMITGSLARYGVYNRQGEELAGKTISKLPGWPEYFAGFARVDDRRVIGVTSGYRAIVIDAKTYEVIAEKPVF